MNSKLVVSILVLLVALWKNTSRGVPSPFITRLFAMLNFPVDLVRENMVLQMLVVGQLTYGAQTSLKAIVSFVWSWMNSFYSSISIDNTDASYNAVLVYASKLCDGEKNSSLVASTAKNRQSWLDEYRSELLGKSVAKLEYRPDREQIRTFYFKGKRILMIRSKGETLTVGYDRNPKEMEKLTLSTWGWDGGILKQFFQEALKNKVKDDCIGVSVIVQNVEWPYGWKKALDMKPRSEDSVILDGSIAENLLSDVTKFLANRTWYSERNIPYRRGYLLYGPPGTGKTSFCQVIASRLQLDICILSLSSKELTDAKLAREMRSAPQNSLILLEDVDAIFVQRSKADAANSNNVTFSGLLNALDGVSSSTDGRIMLMTTNHIERLDGALIRPGRCDVKVELKNASRAQMRRMFKRFFPDCEEHVPERFALALPEYELSMAELQGYLMQHSSAPSALASVKELLKIAEETAGRDVLQVCVAERTTVFACLERLGLESLAPHFVSHGYLYADEVFADQLSVGVVADWTLELKYDRRQRRRLERLLKEGAKQTKEFRDYQVVPASEIKDAFLRTFASVANQHADSAHRSQLVKLASEFCVLLCEEDGRPFVSYYGLRELFKMESHCPESCVAEAKAFATRRVIKQQRLNVVPPEMSTWQWMKRAGLHHTLFAARLEQAGYSSARAFLKLSKDELRDEIGIRVPVNCRQQEEKDAVYMLSLMKATTDEESATAGLALISRWGLRASFLAAFPGSEAACLKAFQNSFCDDLGTPLASLRQVQRYLEAKTADGASAEDAASPESIAAWLNVAMPRIPEWKAPPEPTDWVYTWLKAAGLQSYASNFEEAGLSSQADILSTPVITARELQSDLGVKTLGHRRRLLRMIELEHEKRHKTCNGVSAQDN